MKCSDAMPAAQVASVDAEARRIWRYGEESFSEAWLRAYLARKGTNGGTIAADQTCVPQTESGMLDLQDPGD